MTLSKRRAASNVTESRPSFVRPQRHSLRREVFRPRQTLHSGSSLATYSILAARPTSFSISESKASRTVFTTHAAFRQRPVPDRAAADALRFRLRGKKIDAERPGISRTGKQNIPAKKWKRPASPIPPAASGPASSAPALLVIGSMIVALAHRNQQRDLPERVQPEHALHSPHSYRDSQSRRRAFDCFRISSASACS